MPDRIYFEDPRDANNSALFVADDADSLTVEVSETRAVEEINDTFTCSYRLTRTQAIELRDFISSAFGSET